MSFKKLLLRKRVVFSAVFSLLLVPVFLLFFNQNRLDSAFGALCAGVCGAFLSEILVKNLNKWESERAHDSTAKYSVFVNGVCAGEIARSRYAGLWLEAYRDYRLYFSQVMNLFQVFLRIADYAFIGIPVAVFWGAIIAYTLDQSLFFQVLHYVMDVQNAKVIFKLVVPIVALSVVLSINFGRRFGFVNKFSKHVSDRVRMIIGVPAEGHMFVAELKETPADDVGSPASPVA